MQLDHEAKLRSYPVQYVETADGILIKRGCTQLKIRGQGAPEVVRAILAKTSRNAATFNEISASFPTEVRPHLEQLTNRLISCHLLMPSNGTPTSPDIRESNLDVFYWHFGKSGSDIADKLNRLYLTVLGVNCISRQFGRSLTTSKVHNFRVVDVPALRNQQMFDAAGSLLKDEWPADLGGPVTNEAWEKSLDTTPIQCLIATSDVGNTEDLREWNRFCVQRQLAFVPIVLQDLVGYIGPLVIPGESACYECLRARLNSNNDNPPQEISPCIEQSIVGFHPTMASILGDFGAFEVMKMLGDTLPNRKMGTLIEIKLLIPELKARKVLKIPRCRVCSPMYTRASSAATKDPFTPISELNR